MRPFSSKPSVTGKCCKNTIREKKYLQIKNELNRKKPRIFINSVQREMNMSVYTHGHIVYIQIIFHHQRNEWCMAYISCSTENITCTFPERFVSRTFWLEKISVLAISGQICGTEIWKIYWQLHPFQLFELKGKYSHGRQMQFYYFTWIKETDPLGLLTQCFMYVFTYDLVFPYLLILCF